MLGACRGVAGATSQGCGKVACLEPARTPQGRTPRAVDEPKPKMYTPAASRAWAASFAIWSEPRKFNNVDAEHAPEDRLVAPNP